ncbi:DNA polymerase/3'-5' exonuclease PolX [Reichenbachiella versicolor]|uniref:DNA polymerase/3'-5' exonuclease PolX n=1 Tax=Reichenbachiella versicolor TaxID=1821036 RepID=UPI000D6DF88A|nr:DNA polymerase/3'-5' exonuclease PolX [Reichenbachiella versicolor]
MTNSEINQKLKLATQLMELHGENPFKIRSYQSGREVIKSLSQELSEVDQLESVQGIGKSLAKAIEQILESGSFDKLNNYLELTPEGVIEMMKIPGFGPKKIAILWKDAGAETLEQVKAMCEVGSVAELKGFAVKTQDSLASAVDFVISCRGKMKYAIVEPFIELITSSLKDLKSIDDISEVGPARRKMEVLDSLELVIGTDDFELSRTEINSLSTFHCDNMSSGPFTWKGYFEGLDLPVLIRFSSTRSYIKTLFDNTGSMSHLSQLAVKKHLKVSYQSEREIYESVGSAYIEPEMREGLGEVELAKENKLPKLLEMEDLNGILHNHSTYSDGKHTLREMAEYCKELGYEYLGITDHSQTAVYANGLQDYRVKEQQMEIKELNKELSPFKIFSGIESDILADGSLDYSEEVLSSFDFIVSSIHSGLTMDRAKATKRLLTAIYNPHTTILGHMTGRLILEREGYPVDHKAIIDACAETGVVIEINASPYRLDIDWRWVDYAIQKGVKLSINPDAHSMSGYHDMKYGVMVGRKGGLTKEMTLNALSHNEISEFFESRKRK